MVSLVKNLYLMATVTVASVFTALFLVGSIVYGQFYWYCFIPILLVVWDFIRTRSSERPRQVFFSIERINLAPVEVEKEDFIKEWEFKV